MALSNTVNFALNKKICEVQSSNIRDYAANDYPPKSNFSEGHISARKKYCPPNIYRH